MFVTSYTGNGVKKNYYNQISEYRYKKNYYTVGEFSLTISAFDPGEPYRIAPGDILYVYDPDCVNDSLYVTTTECVRGRYIISGFDLKIILNWRITLFPTEELEAGTYGYDCRQGYTGNIIKGYIDYNLCEASDPNRQLPGCWCTVDAGIGIENDTYMSRLQPLNEVVEALCANAGLGYDVFFDYLSDGNIGINIYEGADRRFGGIAFGAYMGNSDGIKLIRDNTAERSVVWAVNGIGVKDCTVTAVNLSDSVSAGIERKEAVVTTNCSVADVKIYAKKAAEDYTATEEIDASADGSGYGDLFNVGDVVRVFDDGGGTSEMRIISVEKQYSGHSRRIKLSFADYFKPKLRKKVVNKLSAANTENKKDIIDQKIDTASGGEENNGLTIEQAVIIKEEDAKYLLHNFTEIEYNSGMQIGYAGPENQIIVQGLVFNKFKILIEGNIDSRSNAYSFPFEYYPAFSKYLSVDKTFYTDYNNKFKKFIKMSADFVEANADGNYIQRNFNMTDPDGITYLHIANSRNWFNWQGYGFSWVWDSIHPPNSVMIYPGLFDQSYTAEFGYVKARMVWIYRNHISDSDTSNQSKERYVLGYRDNPIFFFPFLSIDEYNAAVGLTYEPLTLTEVVDNPTVVSGKDIGEGVT